jgi:hypothetical protein
VLSPPPSENPTKTFRIEAPLTPRVSRKRNLGSYLKRSPAYGPDTTNEGCSIASAAATGSEIDGVTGVSGATEVAGVIGAGAVGEAWQLALKAASATMQWKRKQAAGIPV